MWAVKDQSIYLSSLSIHLIFHVCLSCCIYNLLSRCQLKSAWFVCLQNNSDCPFLEFDLWFLSFLPTTSRVCFFLQISSYHFLRSATHPVIHHLLLKCHLPPKICLLSQPSSLFLQIFSEKYPYSSHVAVLHDSTCKLHWFVSVILKNNSYK